MNDTLMFRAPGTQIAAGGGEKNMTIAIVDVGASALPVVIEGRGPEGI